MLGIVLRPKHGSQWYSGRQNKGLCIILSRRALSERFQSSVMCRLPSIFCPLLLFQIWNCAPCSPHLRPKGKTRGSVAALQSEWQVTCSCQVQNICSPPYSGFHFFHVGDSARNKSASQTNWRNKGPGSWVSRWLIVVETLWANGKQSARHGVSRNRRQ